jgi:type I restriction enzyme S subunit
MIEGLKPYSDMRDTGLPWLGQVAAHWDVRRNGRLFGSRRETGFPDLPVLEVSLRSGVRVRDFDNGTRKQEMGDRSKYQRAVRGDIAYNMMRMWQGAVGIAPVDGLVSPAYVVARPFAETDAAYYAYLFRTAAYMREVDTFSRGIVPDRNRLYWESFKQMPSVYPPLDEQRLIVRLLDWHGAQTAKLIRAKKKIIALLNEQKQAIIHRAVTRGLDPNARLKPSGVPWLGDVPEEWEVVPCRALFAEVREREAPEEELLSVTIRNGVIPQKELLDNSSKKDSSNLDKTKYKLVLPGDIAYNKMRAWQGAFGASAYRGIISPAYVVQRPRAGALSHYYHYLLRTPSFAKEAEKWSYGIVSDMWSLRPEHFRLIYCPKPPEAEQRSICEHLEIATRDIVFTIQAIEREIALIQEFRTRLIADVVTGKLDVRAAAASMPETVEIEAADELVEDDDLDEAVDDAENEEVAA